MLRWPNQPSLCRPLNPIIHHAIASFSWSEKQKGGGANGNGYWGSAALANVLLYGVRCRPKAPWRNFPTGKGVAPLCRQQGRAGGGGEGGGEGRGRPCPYAKARVQHALYCYFARSFTNVACGFALTHAVPSPLTKFAADPLHRKFLQSSAKGKAVIAEKIAGDAQPKIATGSVRVNFHHPYVIKYQ